MKSWPERLLALAGMCLIGAGGWSIVRYQRFQRNPEYFKLQNVSRPVMANSSFGRSSAESGVLGRLDIPRVRMTVLIVEGDDDESLGLAAGHVSGTAEFGASGNTVIAGHRDTAFRELRSVKVGDQICIEAGKTYHYIVKAIRIVGPDDVSVLESGNDATLTLVTCYPFIYIGAAPQRYIVTAKLVRVSIT
ncbi:MAG: class D sortase [Acidobacteriaceae bacterium]|nr:class D sortase [Acidobacteriaceae bacterium]